MTEAWNHTKPIYLKQTYGDSYLQSSGCNKKQTSWSTTSQGVMHLVYLGMNPNLSLKWTEVWTSHISHVYFGSRLEMESDGTRWRTGGEVKGKEASGVGSQQSCTVSEHVLSSITTADAHTSAASSQQNWHPRRYKWTRPFRWKTKSGFCACAITFRFHFYDRMLFDLSTTEVRGPSSFGQKQ